MRKIMVVALVAWATAAQADETPCAWQQSEPGNLIGASQTQTPAKVLEAIKLVRTGEVFRLGHVYDQVTLGEPPFGRVFSITISPFSFPDQPDNSQAFNTGVVNATLGQLATQFDALGHAGHDLGFYNCVPASDLGPDELGRLEKLGVETVKPFFTRALLLDFVAHSEVPKITVDGHEMVEDSYVITLADVQDVLAKQGLGEPGEGDVVLFYTGWDSLFGIDNERHFNSPGAGIEVAKWLASKKIAMLGTDTQHSEAAIGGRSTELVEAPDALGSELGFMFNAVHFILLTQNGIHIMEWMRLGELAEALGHDGNAENSPYEFLFVYSPIPIKGLAGAPASPLAVR
jgi:kynurenine formamidase